MSINAPNVTTLRAIQGGKHAAAVSRASVRRHYNSLEPALQLLDEAIAEAAPPDLPAAAVGIAARLATVACHLLVAAGNDAGGEVLDPGLDRYLTPAQAAAMAGVNQRWILRNTRGQRFRKNLSRKQVRLQEAGFRRWLDARTSRARL